MCDEDGSVEVGEHSVGSRKRKLSGGKRKSLKGARYAAPKKPLLFVPCIHDKKFACVKFRPRDYKIFNSNFYKKPDKQRQDSIVATLVSTEEVKRRRARPANTNKRQKPGGEHEYNVSYFLPTLQFGKIQVCKKFFLSVVSGIGRTRLKNIVNRVHCSEPIEEKRGGNRVGDRNNLKKEKVKEFISKLKGTELHYNRNKSKRIYLSCDLSIKKLWAMYNDQASDDTKVAQPMFRRIFNQYFNLGFRSPASDACSTCCLLKEKIRGAAHGSAEQQRYMVEKRIHTKRAKAFYEYLKENDIETNVSLCFDLQQIQPLPKTPIQEAFYSRQINLYNFCITDLKGKNPAFYIWTEDQAGKGSTEISSAILSHLSSMDFEGKSTLRLFCDGCTSQNKNNIVLRSLVHFLQKTKTSLKKILIFFPVRGHSFLPADRVFGRAEKLLRKQPVILGMEDYFDIYRTIGEVKYLGEEWNLLSTKELNEYYKDLESISKAKRIVIKVREDGDKVLRVFKGKQIVAPSGHPLGNQRQVIVKGMNNYRFEDENENFVSLRKKKNFNYSQVVLKSLPPIGMRLHKRKRMMSTNYLKRCLMKTGLLWSHWSMNG